MNRKRPLPPVYFFASLGLVVVLHVWLPGPRILGSPWRLIGLIPLVAGLFIMLWADGLFKRLGTTIKPFQESSSLVTNGPFRFSRNPMYLGVLFIIVGVAALFGSRTPFIVAPIVFWITTAHFIVPEETSLERQFGEAFIAYTRSVRRWL